MRLNIGCGDKKMTGYINIDIRPEVDPDILLDIEKIPYDFDTSSIDVIKAIDVVEHISHHNAVKVLKEWYRILKNDGELIIRMPCMDRIITDVVSGGLLSDWWQLSYHLFGGQDYPENTHKLIFTKSEIKRVLAEIGFVVYKIEHEGGYNMIVCARAVK